MVEGKFIDVPLIIFVIEIFFVNIFAFNLSVWHTCLIMWYLIVMNLKEGMRT